MERFFEKIKIIYVRPELSEHVGVRVGKAINHVLSNIDLGKYDFLLKIDADVAIPLDFIERCLRLEADLVGLGSFMLVRTKPFIRLLGGRWPEVPADDAYVMMCFRAAGLKTALWPKGVILKRKSGGNWKYYYYRGICDFKIGLDPTREFLQLHH